MEGIAGSHNLKRPRCSLADQDSDRPPPSVEKRPRFPKGKKAKRGSDANADGDSGDGIGEWIMDPKLAAKERVRRRNQIREDELFQGGGDISSAEVYYEDNATLEDDGIQLEPFNLKQEREEGYFDADGNFVHCTGQDEIKDAWLDSVDVEPRFAERKHDKIIPEEDDYQDLSSEDIGKIKRSIANLLQPGETIIQALKRLKGSSSDIRDKMSKTAQHMFDQLTENAMKLMENGEYNVYHEEREIFEREAEGYERLARAKDGTVGSDDIGFNASYIEDVFSNGMGHGGTHSSVLDMPASSSEANVSSLQVSSSDMAEELDMFGEDDEMTHENLQSDGTAVCSGSTSEQILQPTSKILDSSHDLGSEEAIVGGFESDYVYDQSTGYYYSSSLGYYYDPASGLYCCATSGTWYSYDENSGAYNEIQNATSEEVTLSGQ